ncbi:MAG: hypothetical protein IJ639_11190, partial [Ruminococcus sp.]|nr:hypothetical protein [Ruminococcus sp.]
MGDQKCRSRLVVVLKKAQFNIILGIGILLTDHNVRDALSITTCSHIISEGRILVSGGKKELLSIEIKPEAVDPDDVEIGTIIVVQPGERIPIDGKIVSGATTLDTKALTGESLPREAKIGDEALSGCINLSGVIRIETTKEADESTAAKILELVENSSMK